MSWPASCWSGRRRISSAERGTRAAASRSVRGIAERRQQTVEVLGARAAGVEVRRDPGVAQFRPLTRQPQLDVDVKDVEGFGAADVARVGGQESVERGPAVHLRLKTSRCR